MSKRPMNLADEHGNALCGAKNTRKIVDLSELEDPLFYTFCMTSCRCCAGYLKALINTAVKAGDLRFPDKGITLEGEFFACGDEVQPPSFRIEYQDLTDAEVIS